MREEGKEKTRKRENEKTRKRETRKRENEKTRDEKTRERENKRAAVWSSSYLKVERARRAREISKRLIVSEVHSQMQSIVSIC